MLCLTDLRVSLCACSCKTERFVYFYKKMIHLFVFQRWAATITVPDYFLHHNSLRPLLFLFDSTDMRKKFTLLGMVNTYFKTNDI